MTITWAAQAYTSSLQQNRHLCGHIHAVKHIVAVQRPVPLAMRLVLCPLTGLENHWVAGRWGRWNESGEGHFGTGEDRKVGSSGPEGAGVAEGASATS